MAYHGIPSPIVRIRRLSPSPRPGSSPIPQQLQQLRRDNIASNVLMAKTDNTVLVNNPKSMSRLDRATRAAKRDLEILQTLGYSTAGLSKSGIELGQDIIKHQTILKILPTRRSPSPLQEHQKSPIRMSGDPVPSIAQPELLELLQLQRQNALELTELKKQILEMEVNPANKRTALERSGSSESVSSGIQKLKRQRHTPSLAQVSTRKIQSNGSVQAGVETKSTQSDWNEQENAHAKSLKKPPLAPLPIRNIHSSGYPCTPDAPKVAKDFVVPTTPATMIKTRTGLVTKSKKADEDDAKQLENSDRRLIKSYHKIMSEVSAASGVPPLKANSRGRMSTPKKLVSRLPARPAKSVVSKELQEIPHLAIKQLSTYSMADIKKAWLAEKLPLVLSRHNSMDLSGSTSMPLKNNGASSQSSQQLAENPTLLKEITPTLNKAKSDIFHISNSAGLDLVGVSFDTTDDGLDARTELLEMTLGRLDTIVKKNNEVRKRLERQYISLSNASLAEIPNPLDDLDNIAMIIDSLNAGSDKKAHKDIFNAPAVASLPLSMRKDNIASKTAVTTTDIDSTNQADNTPSDFPHTLGTLDLGSLLTSQKSSTNLVLPTMSVTNVIYHQQKYVDYLNQVLGDGQDVRSTNPWSTIERLADALLEEVIEQGVSEVVHLLDGVVEELVGTEFQ